MSNGVAQVAEMGVHPKNLTPEAKLSTRVLHVTHSRYQSTAFTLLCEGGMQQTRGHLLIECHQHKPR